MMQEKISLIIPAYNVENLLGRTLDSLLSQTYTNLEIIVVNDGSRDKTAAVLDTYAASDARIRAIHKENGGVSTARLRGIREATGAWIGFVDADDVAEPWMFEKLLTNAKAYDADISHCGYQMVLPSGKIRLYHGTGKLVIQDNNTGIKDLLDNQFVEPGLWNKLYARHVVEEFMASVDFDTSIRNMEDLLMNYYLFRIAKRSVYEDVCPYHYIVRSDSAANAAVSYHKLEGPLQVKSILFRETERNLQHHGIIANQLVRQLVSYASMDLGTSPEVTGPIRTRARAELRRMIPGILTDRCYSSKFRIMGLWAAVWPWSYGFVHRTYERITKIDKIYEK